MPKTVKTIQKTFTKEEVGEALKAHFNLPDNATISFDLSYSGGDNDSWGERFQPTCNCPTAHFKGATAVIEEIEMPKSTGVKPYEQGHGPNAYGAGGSLG